MIYYGNDILKYILNGKEKDRGKGMFRLGKLIKSGIYDNGENWIEWFLYLFIY